MRLLLLLLNRFSFTNFKQPPTPSSLGEATSDDEFEADQSSDYDFRSTKRPLPKKKKGNTKKRKEG